MHSNLEYIGGKAFQVALFLEKEPKNVLNESTYRKGMVVWSFGIKIYFFNSAWEKVESLLRYGGGAQNGL